MPKETKTKSETVRANASTGTKKKSRALASRPSAAIVVKQTAPEAGAGEESKRRSGSKTDAPKTVAMGKKKIAKGKEADPQVVAGPDGKPEAETFARWTGKNFIRRQWEKPFYQICLIASLAVILLSFTDGSWLRAVTFFALAFILVFELRDEPRDIGYEINIDGIEIDGKLYRFEDIRSFALGKKAGFDIVTLEMRKSLFPARELHLAEGQDTLYIETLLEYFLPNEMQENVLFNFHKEESSADLSEEEFIKKKVDEYLKGHF